MQQPTPLKLTLARWITIIKIGLVSILKEAQQHGKMLLNGHGQKTRVREH